LKGIKRREGEAARKQKFPNVGGVYGYKGRQNGPYKPTHRALHCTVT